MYCKYCGREIDDSAKFCNYCGKEISSIETEGKGFLEMIKDTYRKTLEEENEKRKEEIKIKLQPRNGKIHILITSEKIELLNEILEMIQDEGYEIVDIKRTGRQNAGSTILMETLIMYK